MSAPSVEVRKVRYAYGDHVAVDGVSFEVGAGEVVGLLGPNGAGKSTSIKLLTGQLDPLEGEIRVLGRDVSRDREAVQSRIGVTFEQQNLYEDMTVTETLEFFASLFGATRFDCAPLLARVALSDRAAARVGTLSKGLRQRLMIARSLVNAPQVLFLDEPTAGLDPVSAGAIKAIVKEEASRGTAILLTTHDMYTADELSDRIAFIHRGQLLAVDTPENLKVAHGERRVRVRVRTGDTIRESTIELDRPDAAERVLHALSGHQVVTIHTEEASLEEVFVKFAGRGLQE